MSVDVGDLAPGGVLPVACGRYRALLCNVDGAFYAVAERCTHAAFSMAEGRLEGAHLECPLHGALFDVRDGSPVRRPANKPLSTYPVELRGTRAEIRFD
ncbi:MAG: Rieske 2Fe-2S domain-containing protein [Myxococcota bacterium]